jgi:D-ribose pyranose/furanose isomerase RbsD
MNFSETLARLGHRNWVCVVDAAFPEMVAPGLTIITGHTIEEVWAAVEQAPHVRGEVFLDAELDALDDRLAPGSEAIRTSMEFLFAPSPITKLPHDEIIAMIDQAAQVFRILVVKTDCLIPYTSAFIRLDCGYWDAASEIQLRTRLSALQ